MAKRKNADVFPKVVEIKGYHREDSKEKAETMKTYWMPGVNRLGHHGRWAFAELTEVYQMESEFAAKVKGCFTDLITRVTGGAARDRGGAVVG
ncbi:MAG: hypothetical protein FJ309_16570 [Planctomycetes bacterium]|nr:hypothetical protein [Planctomycetota bacterium]MBM4056983.1 hypothetical protein [Planctomycetota bacterium]